MYFYAAFRFWQSFRASGRKYDAANPHVLECHR